jgi:hypothetical protein
VHPASGFTWRHDAGVVKRRPCDPVELESARPRQRRWNYLGLRSLAKTDTFAFINFDFV